MAAGHKCMRNNRLEGFYLYEKFETKPRHEGQGYYVRTILVVLSSIDEQLEPFNQPPLLQAKTPHFPNRPGTRPRSPLLLASPWLDLPKIILAH